MNLIGDGGHAFDGQRHQSRIAPLDLESGQVGGRHLAALAGYLEQPVLVDQPLNARWQVQRLPGLEALDVFKHVPRVRLGRRLAQPRQPVSLAAFLALEQLVQTLTVDGRQGVRQCGVNVPIRAGDRFCAGALDGVYDRQDDALPPEIFDQRTGQHDSLVGLQGQLGQRMHLSFVIAHGEGLESEHRLELDQMLPPGLPALPILIPAFHRHFELRRHHTQ